MAVLGTNSNTVGLLIKADADTGAITATTVQLDEMGKMAEVSAAKASSSFENFNKSLNNVGKQAEAVGKSLSTYVTLPIVGVAAESVKMAVNFQQTMEMLHTNAGTAQSAIAGLSQSVLDMAGQVGAKPEELAQAFYHIASAGNGIWSTAKQLDILKISAEGAAIGQASLDDTTYSLTSTMASNIKGAQDASEAMSTLTAIVGAGDMHFQDLNAAIGTGFLGTAASFGISLSSVGAALATLTDNGEHADAAATRLRMTWALMASPSKQATKMLEDLGLTADGAALATDQMNTVFAKTGLSTTKLATDLQQPNGMNVALKDLQDHLHAAGLNAAETDSMLAKAFGGGRTDAAMLTMLQNLDRTDEKFKLINDSAGQFSEKWGAQQETANQKFKDAWAGIQADMIKLGTDIMPIVTKDFEQLSFWVQDVSKWFEGLNEGQKSFVIHAVEITAAVGPAILIFGKLATSLASIGKLTSTVFGGLMSIGGAARGIGSMGGLAALGGEGAAAGEALGAGGLLAALGPIGLGIGALGLAAGGAYLLVKHFNDINSDLADNLHTNVDPKVQAYQDLAKNLGVTLKNTGANTTLLSLAQVQVANDTDLVSAATKQQKQLQTDVAAVQKTVKQRSDEVATAQLGVNDALKKYGANSPQYQKAVDDLATKQSALNDQLSHSIGFSLDLYNKTGQLSDAEKNLKNDTANLAGIQDYLNGKIYAGVGAVAQFGPTALNQVGNIHILQTAIDGINIGWSNAVSSINIQSGNVGSILQNVSYGISQIQGQSNTLNNSLSAAKSSVITLQAGVGGIQGSSLNPQHRATGTNYARGGWSWVGENGPEKVYLPEGSTVKTATQSAGNSSGNGGHQHNTSIQTVVLASKSATVEFFKQLDQDTILTSRGLTPARGMGY